MTLFIVRQVEFSLRGEAFHSSYQIRQPGYPLEAMHHPYNIRMWVGWPDSAKIAKAQSTELSVVPDGLRTGNGRCTEIIGGFMYAGGKPPDITGQVVQVFIDRLNLANYIWEEYDPPPITCVNTHPAVIVPDYYCIQDGYIIVALRLGNWWGPNDDEFAPSNGTEIWRIPVDNNGATWERVHSQGHGFTPGPDAPMLVKLPSGKLVFPQSTTSMWSDDGGATWNDDVPAGGAIPPANLARVAPIQLGTQAIYHSGSDFIRLNDDLTYTTIDANVPSPSNDQGWQRLAVDDLGNIIYVNGLGGVYKGTVDDTDWPDISGDLPPGGVFTYGRAIVWDTVRQEWYFTSDDTGEPHVYGFMPDLSKQTFSIQLDPVIGSGGGTADVIHLLPEEEA